MIFVISLLAFLFGALATNIVIWTETRMGYLDLFPILIAIGSFATCGWTVACGVAMLKMRAWARTSALAFGAILLAITVAGAVKMILDPTAGVLYLEGAYVGSTRPEMIALLVWFAVLGGLWLYFFTRNRVKARFIR
jgi:hypothetical protein